MKFKSSSGCIGLNPVYLYVSIRIYKQIYRGSPSDCESVYEIFYSPLAEADPTKPYILTLNFDFELGGRGLEINGQPLINKL
jgi:hypothetical protein